MPGVKLILQSACVLMAWSLGLPMPARADEACNKSAQILSSLPMTDTGNLVTIPVGFGGVQKQFLLDTGGVFTEVSSSIASALKLPATRSPVRIYAVDGTFSRNDTRVPDFMLGTMHLPQVDMQISSLDVDGIFAPLAFKDYDFEMDFAAHRLNILSNEHCDGKTVYWPAPAVAAVPVEFDHNHIAVPVTVDGHALTATIDTGASTSAMRLDIARSVFDLVPESPGMKIVGHVGGDDSAAIYRYPFKILAFHGVTVTNPRIVIFTDVRNRNADRRFGANLIAREGGKFTLPEVIVGMDVLRKLHLYLAIKEKRLYLTEAPEPASTPSH